MATQLVNFIHHKNLDSPKTLGTPGSSCWPLCNPEPRRFQKFLATNGTHSIPAPRLGSNFVGRTDELRRMQYLGPQHLSGLRSNLCLLATERRVT